MDAAYLIWWAYQNVFIPWSPNRVGLELVHPWNDDVSNHCLLWVMHMTKQADGMGNRWINILFVEVWMSGYRLNRNWKAQPCQDFHSTCEKCYPVVLQDPLPLKVAGIIFYATSIITICNASKG
jgi:hypothetical protein